MLFLRVASLLFLADAAFACNPWTPLVELLCFVGDGCTGDVFVIPPPPGGWPVGRPTVQDCFTNNGEAMGPGGSPGGDSCVCQENKPGVGPIDVCATVKKQAGFNKKPATLFVDRRMYPTGEPIDGGELHRLELEAPFMWGDPHIKGWGGRLYDWHGQCDTVMMHTPNFNSMGLEIHVRTKIRYDYSFIETAAIRLGDDILEVSGFGQHFLNGVGDADTPATFGDFFLTHKKLNEHDHLYTIELGPGSSIFIKTHNDIVGVGFHIGGNADWFTNSTGLMGSFETGELLARDGLTVINDPNQMGQEWQVRDDEPKLFQNMDRAPQYPDKCLLPSPTARDTRRLGETRGITEEAAEIACRRWMSKEEKEACIYDVMAVGDLGMADVGAN